MIFHVITQLGIGGAEQQLFNVIRDTSSLGYTHTVAYLQPPADLAEELEKSGTHTIELGSERRWPWRGAASLLEPHFRQLKPTIIQSWLFDARLAVYLAGGAHYAPWIATVMGTDYDRETLRASGRSRLKAEVCKKIERTIDKRTQVQWIAASEASRKSYVGEVCINADRIDVIHNSVSDDLTVDPQAGRQLRKKLGISPDDIVFLLVARLIQGKGIEDLIRAFNLIAIDEPRARLVLVGEGPLRAFLTELVRDSPRSERILLAGAYRDVGPALAMSNVFVFPSHSEGFALALAEAMSAGLPCVVSDIASNIEVIGDATNALTVRVGDVDGIARAMRALVSNPTMAQHYGSRAAEYAHRHLSSRESGRHWHDLYARVGRLS